MNSFKKLPLTIIDKILKYLDEKNLVVFAIIDDDSLNFLKERISINKNLRDRVKIYLESSHQFSYTLDYKPDSYMLKSCNYLVKIKIPNYVTSLGYNCFSGCSKLEQVIFPKYLNRIGSWTFYNCPRLKKLIFPDRLIYIESFTFWKSKGVEEIISKNKKLKKT